MHRPIPVATQDELAGVLRKTGDRNDDFDA